MALHLGAGTIKSEMTGPVPNYCVSFKRKKNAEARHLAMHACSTADSARAWQPLLQLCGE